MPKTFVIADDHALASEGIKAILERHDNTKILEVANNGISAISLIRKLQPDCAIVDLAMPGANGLEVLIEAKRWAPDTKIVIVTGNHSPEQFRQLKEADADAIILKNTDPEVILEAIQRVFAGEKVFSDEVQEIISVSEDTSGLSKREIEVLHAIGRGYSNTKIGEKLGVSPKTVDSHRTSLMRKLEVNSTAALLVKAMKQGLIDV
ncbi:MAG: response regulator transcription factor [Pseudomonadota bacterium]